jgi:glutaredoxin-related protein
LKLLTHKEPVMLFMKGTPGAEKCGFSRTITSLLNEKGIKYGIMV